MKRELANFIKLYYACLQPVTILIRIVKLNETSFLKVEFIKFRRKDMFLSSNLVFRVS